MVGVSDKRESGANLNYGALEARDYRVYSVNPRISGYDGAPYYPDLKFIPERPDAVFMLTSPHITDQIVQQCVDLGIKHVRMHCLMGTKPGLSAGTTSGSQSAVDMCRANGINVIPGTCPAQFLESGFAHGMMRLLWTMRGFLSVE